MYKPLRIIVFLAVFLCLMLLPLLAQQGNAAAEPPIALETPEIQALDEQACIEQTSYMRANHMQLLDSWRNEVVRYGTTHYVASSGQIYEMSLETTCFDCHSNRAEFCLSCHDYAGVETDCWNCHDGGEAANNS